MNIVTLHGAALDATVNASGYSLSYEPTAEERFAEMVKRFVGCVILSALPYEGLDEALGTLADYYEYYLAPQALPAVAAVTEEYRGRIVHESRNALMAAE